MTVKTCNTCGSEKELELFAKGKAYKDGYRNICKRCHTDYMLNYYEQKNDKRDAKNKMNTKYVAPWKRHHLTEKEYNSLLNMFNGRCHVCREEEATSIDHDHTCCPQNRSCGKCVRGILCRGCNTALGSLKENNNTISNLLKYISPR
jgi:hypothetical protein